MKKAFIITIAAAVIAACTAFFVNMHMNQNVYVTRYDYFSEKTPIEFYGYKIAVISDIHNNIYADKFIERLDKEKPDMLIFAGDMIQLPYTNLDNVIKIAEAEKDSMPIYAVWGNHEASNGNAVRKAMAEELEKSGVHMLFDDFDDVKINRSKIRIIGIKDCADESVDDETAKGIKQTIEKLADEDELNIAVYHRADVFPRISSVPADLIISGHMHGGVVRLPFAGGVIGKKKGEFFPKYTSGIFEENGTTMAVSRGCDYNLHKIRVFNPPEIMTIVLHGNAK